MPWLCSPPGWPAPLVGHLVAGFAIKASGVEGGRNVFHGDPTDLDFWGRADPESEDKEENKIRLALLAMPKFSANVETANLIIQFGFKCLIAASVRFDDEVTALKEIGVHAAFNFFEEAGAGLAEAAYEKLESQMNALAQENKK